MAKKKKVTRKQLLKEPDEFITTAGKLIRFIQTYKTQISYAVGALVVLMLVATGIYYYSAARENSAFSLFEQAMVKYDATKRSEGMKPAYEAVQPDFEGILDKYSGNNGGKIARFAFANICYDAGDFDRAIELYTQSLEDFKADSFYRKLIISGIGHAHEGKKDLKTAATFFETITAEPDAFLKDEALFHLGEFYEAMGNPAKSHEVFKKIISEYPASMYIDMVSEKVSG